MFSGCGQTLSGTIQTIPNIMKGRPKSIRKISFIPAVSGFRPYGGNASQSRLKGIYLLYEEYESLRLNDYEKHTQCESAAIMGVSRPTFTRIYQSAREKIAKAFVEGLRIIIEGGKVQLDGDWYVCSSCGALFSTAGQEENSCPLCGSAETSPYAIGDGAEEKEKSAPVSTYEGLRLAVPGRKSAGTCRKKTRCRRKSCQKQDDLL